MPLYLTKLHKKWRECQPLPKENYEALWLWIRMRFSHLSNSFEGNTLTYSETQLLLIHGRAAGDHKLREYEEMKAHDIAFEYVRRLAKEERPLGEADIRDLNKICLKEPFYAEAQTAEGAAARKKIIPGEYKAQPNHVLTKTGEVFRFASPEETPLLMADLAKWIQSWLQKKREEKMESLVSFLAELHKRFISIHPFDDGNGRVIRLLMGYMLIRLDFPPMILPGRDEYIKAIEFSDAGDMSFLEKLFADSIASALKRGVFAKTHKIGLNDELSLK